MIKKLIFFGLICSTIIQAFPTSDADPQDEDGIEPFEPDDEATPTSKLIADDERKKTCDQKLAWFKNVTEKTKKYYDIYYAKVKGVHQLNSADTSHIQADHEKFKQLVNESLDKYQKDKEKLFTIHDDTARLAFCQKEIDWYKALDHNLTGIATNVRSNVLDLLDAVGVPKNIRDTLDETLSRVVNFLFIIDMSKNTFRDIRNIVNEIRGKPDNKGESEKEKENDEKNKEEEKEKEIEEKGKEVEKGKDILVDYDETALDDHNELDNEIEHDLIDLEDHHQIDEAKERAEERERQREIEEQREREMEHNTIEEHPFEARPVRG